MVPIAVEWGNPEQMTEKDRCVVISRRESQWGNSFQFSRSNTKKKTRTIWGGRKRNAQEKFFRTAGPTFGGNSAVTLVIMVQDGFRLLV